MRAGINAGPLSHLIPAPNRVACLPIQRLAAHFEGKKNGPAVVAVVRDEVGQCRGDSLLERPALRRARLKLGQEDLNRITRSFEGLPELPARRNVLGREDDQPLARSRARFSRCHTRTLCMCPNWPPTPRPPRFDGVHCMPASLILSIRWRLMRLLVRQVSSKSSHIGRPRSVVVLRGLHRLRTGQASSQTSRVVNQHRKMLRTYADIRSLVLDAHDWNLVRTATTSHAFPRLLIHPHLPLSTDPRHMNRSAGRSENSGRPHYERRGI